MTPLASASSARDLFTAIRHRAATDPLAIAVRSGCRSLAYGELVDRSRAIAGGLRRRGVRAEDRVGICLPRSIDWVVAAVAVLEAGACYLPLDGGLPADRLRFMVHDARAAGVIGEVSTVDRFAGVDGWRATPEDLAAEGASAVAQPSAHVEPDPDQLAYVMYTSGSTGRPKGVAVPHRGLRNLLAWYQTLYRLGPDDRVSQVAAPGFDASLWELWPALFAGAALHIAPEQARLAPRLLRDFLVEEAITIGFAPTPLAEQLVHLPWPDATRLRVLHAGGDRLTRRPPPGLPFVLFNVYGPTETTIVVTVAEVTAHGAGVPTIGPPIHGVTAYVLDESLHPLPDGSEGELWIGGRSALGRGYIGRPAETAFQFMPDPFAAVPGSRMYRTSDRVRRRADGDIEFLGRADGQIKLRGARIEPAEIEHALSLHPEVTQAAVVCREDQPGNRILVAYVVPASRTADGGDADSALIGQLRDRLEATLPAAMVPGAFVVLDALPLTDRGKVDRRALPVPDRASAASGTPPATAIERRVASLWSEQLGVATERVFLEDHFFHSGGHSLLATSLLISIEAAFGVAVPLSDLNATPTLRGLVAAVDRQLAAAAPRRPVPVRLQREFKPR